ncbi:MAG TPA: hypothetical protein VFQ44_21585 [Streptosporangiaceae bacterium]|nr:hypothetical protein [Streptosporangiaceae bacterium]
MGSQLDARVLQDLRVIDLAGVDDLDLAVLRMPELVMGMARPRVEYMIELSIAVGRVAADPRHGDPASRLRDTAAGQFGDPPDAAIERGLEWIAMADARRALTDSKWRLPR